MSGRESERVHSPTCDSLEREGEGERRRSEEELMTHTMARQKPLTRERGGGSLSLVLSFWMPPEKMR